MQANVNNIRFVCPTDHESTAADLDTYREKSEFIRDNRFSHSSSVRKTVKDVMREYGCTGVSFLQYVSFLVV